MISMFTQFFSMLSMLFSAGERGAKSLDNLARWAEEESGSFVSNAALEREAKVAALMAERDIAVHNARAQSQSITAVPSVPTTPSAPATESSDLSAAA